MNLAIFDLDHTLINCDSGTEWSNFLQEEGIYDEADMQRHRQFDQDYRDGCLDLDAYLAFILRALAERSRAELDAMHRVFMQRHILPHISPMARQLVAGHRDAGDSLLLISATNEFIITPIAREFGIGEVIGIRLETDAKGNYTGHYLGTPSFQAGKVTRLQQWLAERGQTQADYEKIYFYSDSRNDLPLLEQVNQPVAVNPDPVLLAAAQQHGWPVLNFF
ncbi:phosphoserine phosphatase [Eikenella longinqua]|uniref:Histidinol-phosphatase n=1 Tax=Eikenella longinqua TaxID=1795827 RepID=A0A1A9RWL4_9NEIS|nr:HAD family hydrolase [Eikenella longinqua]OAM26682.1 phosphoserine phosphatase [Eikenella longinqua]